MDRPNDDIPPLVPGSGPPQPEPEQSRRGGSSSTLSYHHQGVHVPEDDMKYQPSCGTHLARPKGVEVTGGRFTTWRKVPSPE